MDSPGPVRSTARSELSVDGACTAWLIRRDFDPEATFAFSEAASSPGDGPFGFDPPIGGDGSTFAALLRARGVADPVLWRLAEIVSLAASDLEEFPDADALRLDVAFRGLVMLHDDRRALELVGLLIDDLDEAQRPVLLGGAGGGDA
ncbi:MAG: chromate resistance protein [Actinobacteria bacterium]|nr:MAG: chromate resistance protein [Actinomycetota bacterium]